MFHIFFKRVNIKIKRNLTELRLRIIYISHQLTNVYSLTYFFSLSYIIGSDKFCLTKRQPNNVSFVCLFEN